MSTHSETVAVTDIANAITAGECDDGLDFIANAIMLRRDMLRQQRVYEMRATLQPGDRVRLFKVRPQYLEGVEGTVISVADDQAVVDLPYVRRYGGPTTVQLTMLKRVERQEMV